MNKLKNWWLQITTIALVVLDLGFEVINPLLLEIGISEKWSNILKILLGIFAIVKTKLQLPTQNIQKLEEIIEEKKD